MDHGSTEWKDGLLEVTLVMNTQIHSTIGQARKDLSIGVEQEDPTVAPIFESELSSEPEPELELEALIDPQLRTRARTQPRALARAQLYQAPELNSELSSSSELELEPEQEPELNSELWHRAPTRAQARALAQLRAVPGLELELEQSRLNSRLRARAQGKPQAAPEPRIKLSRSGLNSEPSSSSEPELELERKQNLNSRLRARAPTQARAQGRAQLHQAPELGIELRIESSHSEPELGIELRIESSHSEPELSIELELRRGSRARVPAQPRTELAADPIIEKAIAATQRARVSMIRKYTKKHDIQHFNIGAIVSIKVPREDRTSTDNRRLFARILEELYPHRYQVLTPSGIIQRLIPTKSLGVVDQALWSDILIPTSTKQVTLGLAAREASTSARVGISCQ
ncbi:hypothetical protein V502_03049, partial [Pseudogymnoascus sp. VKM F-4520 (FW-2644)]